MWRDCLIESNVSDTGCWPLAKSPLSQIGDDDACVKMMINVVFDVELIDGLKVHLRE